ncbi:hypothetical protein OSB04_025388 [Centaurea solstitialis]|uniref:DC1 domain-containing protein n=1 Tax=Centaurea solstitialis TaxID=347529 RepID=A0AA38SZL6_9ASTR|nr:hypothetical protein OSB04_025388 [Centaurea solstitialis]
MAPLHRSSSAPQPQPQAQPQPHQLLIQHFTHQHPLQKLFMGSQFNCDGCKAAGYGLRYRCASCDFDLHEQCATSPHRIASHLHPHHLLLVNRPGNSHFCDVCKGFADGLSYTCHSQTCEFDVHPLCTGTPVATGIPSVTPPTPAGFNNQPVMMINKQQQQQGVATTGFGGYNNQPVMMINQQYQQFQQQQQQGIGFGGYNGVNNNQQVMINQQQGMGFGGYNNQVQPMMMNQQQQQQQGRTSNYSNVGKIAANILMTSLIGVPLNFNSKN